jgi:HD domain
MGRTASPGAPARSPPPPLGARPGVAARARTLAPVLGTDADLLEAAAWLHDIGFAPGLAVTGLHALDGARYLHDAQHADATLCRLVAHHSYAILEAGERGLADILGLEFETGPYVLSSVLTCCDMTTSPDGELTPVGRRLAEIHHRYGPRAPGQPVNPACHADDPPRSRAGPRPSRPNHISLPTDRANACGP